VKTVPERDAFMLLGEMAECRHVSQLPLGNSVILHTDMPNLLRIIDAPLNAAIRCAITSPPYLETSQAFEEHPSAAAVVSGRPNLSQEGSGVAG